MAIWTLEEAKTHLKAWLDAEIAVTTGQSYEIGSRKLERANLYQIREQIKFWKAEVQKAESGDRRRAYRITPRDL